MIDKLNPKSKELLRTQAHFLPLANLLQCVESRDFTGRIYVTWDNADLNLTERVKEGVLSAKVGAASTGCLNVKNGFLAGAKIGEETSAVDLNESLDALIQLSYGIGCGVCKTMTFQVVEEHLGPDDVCGRFSEMDMFLRIMEIESRVPDDNIYAVV